MDESSEEHERADVREHTDEMSEDLEFRRKDVVMRIKCILATVHGSTGMPQWWRDTLNDAIAEIARLNELLRGVGANRYWEGRWRDADAEVKRLRVELDGWIQSHNNRQAEVEQACAELVRLRRDKEEMLNLSATFGLEIGNLRREKKALVEALRPFADAANWYDRDYANGDVVLWQSRYGISVKIGVEDLWKARAALRSATERKPACQADFSPCMYPTCACSATETPGGGSGGSPVSDGSNRDSRPSTPDLMDALREAISRSATETKDGQS